MATALVKGKLKTAREALSNKDYKKAEQAASDALTFESSNYNARVFLAVAKLNLGDPEAAEEAYKVAIEGQPTTVLAWQGLASLYEKTSNWASYIDTQRKLLDLAKESDDATKCAEALQKILNVQRDHGSSSEVLDTLRLFLPDSPYYDLLSSLPMPDHTAPTSSSTYEAQGYVHNSLPIYEQIVSTKEKDEEEAIDTEVNKRRQRLTTTTSAEETRRIVMRETMSKSELPALYEQLSTHHGASDEVRREFEEKLLRYLYTLLLSLPNPFLGGLGSAISEIAREEEEKRAKAVLKQKNSVRTRIEELARGMTTLRLPVELAWQIILEWNDMESAYDVDTYIAKRYMELFPDSGLTKLAVLVLQLPEPTVTGDVKESKPKTLPLEELSEQVDNAFESAQGTSPKAHVFAATFHLDARNYETAADIAEAGLSRAKTLEGEIGKKLTGLTSVLQTILAVSLVHLNPPHHHLRAQRLLDTLLVRSPDNFQCLLAKAHVHEFALRYQDAYNLFDKVYRELPDDFKQSEQVKFEARKERAWCLGNIEHKRKDALDELFEVAEVIDKREDIDRVEKGKAWWRYGQVLWMNNEPEFTDKAYDAFITSIKRDNTFSPAFTSLGFYYYTRTAELSTALQFFQKAFELDEGEVEAAKILVENFSRTEDWDLVEQISRRVIRNLSMTMAVGSSAKFAESEGSDRGDDLPLAMGKVIAQKYSWAWKAVGAAELKAKRFTQAITALQGAIRGAPSDFNAWIQLAQAYRGSGKHVAALKTLSKVVTDLDPENWHAWFLIGDIQKQIGLYESAIGTFVRLEERIEQDSAKSAGQNGKKEGSEDFIVIKMAIIETYLLLSYSEIRANFVDRAIHTLLTCLDLSIEVLDEYDKQSSKIVWKHIADALSKLGEIVGAANQDLPDVLDIVRDLLARQSQEDIDSRNPSVSPIISTKTLLQAVNTLASQDSDTNISALALAASVLSYSLRLLLEDPKDEGMGSSWFDLGYAIQKLKPVYHFIIPWKAKDLVEGEKEHPSKASAGEELTLQSLMCLKKALALEPLNGTFWNLLGILASENHPKLAQHAFIRACEISGRSAIPWTNLGLFYLAQEDYQLANKAFLKAQVVEPDYARAWIGQSLLASVNGDHKHAEVLLEHAGVISSGLVPEADLTSALVLYNNLPPSAFETSSPSVLSRDGDQAYPSKDLIHAHFVVTRYLARRSDSSTAFHVHGLLSERLHLYPSAITSFKSAVKVLEAEYEAEETDEVERMYVIACISLGRAKISWAGTHSLDEQDLSDNFYGALEDLDTAIGLLQGSDKGDLGGHKLLIQSHLLKAIAYFFMESLELCLESFEQAQRYLDELSSAGTLQIGDGVMKNQYTLLLARVLYSIGGEEQKAEAERQLLDNIFDSSTNSPNLSVIVTLSAIAILSSNSELLDASTAEIMKLPVDKRIESDPQGDLTYLQACSSLLDHQGRLGQGVFTVYSHALHANINSSADRRGLEEALEKDTASDVTGPAPSAIKSIHATPWLADHWTRIH